jgi:hypothetical protein
MMLNRRSRFIINIFEVWVASAALISGVTYLIGKGSIASKAVEVLAPDLVVMFSLLYAAGGLLVLWGLWRGSPPWETAGLALLATGITIVALSLFAILGKEGATSAILQVGLVVACLIRIHLLMKRVI